MLSQNKQSDHQQGEPLELATSPTGMVAQGSSVALFSAVLLWVAAVHFEGEKKGVGSEHFFVFGGALQMRFHAGNLLAPPGDSSRYHFSLL